MNDWPPGLTYAPDIDALEVKLFDGQAPPTPLVSRAANHHDGEVQLHLQRGETDERLYVIVIMGATAAVPSGVLRAAAGTPLPPPGPMRNTPGDWFVPLFAEAAQVSRRTIAVDDGPGRPPLGVMLAASGRIVGFVVPDGRRQLPLNVTGGREA